jgi:hypothetical protein
MFLKTSFLIFQYPSKKNKILFLQNAFDGKLVQVYKQCFADFNPDPSGIIYIRFMPAVSFGSIIFYYNGLSAVFFRSLSHRAARNDSRSALHGLKLLGIWNK